MPFVSDKWETISEIAERKHIKFREAADGVRKEFHEGAAVCRFSYDSEYSGVLEFKSKA